MIRTQIQLPESLYRDLKRLAAQREWSLAEVIRRAGEQFVARYPTKSKKKWQLPEPPDTGGDFLIPPESVHHEANAILAKLSK